MRQEITLNKRALELILFQCGMKSSLYEPYEEAIRTFDAEEYVHVREGLIMSGICEIDFDGKTHIKSPELSRYIYCIMKSSAALYFNDQTTSLIYLKSPVDITKLSNNVDNVTISSETYVCAYDRINEIIKEKKGKLSFKPLIRNEMIYDVDLRTADNSETDNVIGRFMISDFRIFNFSEGDI